MTREQMLRIDAQIRALELMQLELRLTRERLRVICARAGLPTSQDGSASLREHQPAAPADLPGQVGCAPMSLQR